MNHKREPHEGAWMYVSLPQGEPLTLGVTETCRQHGWPVVAATDELADRRLQALRLADACIVDTSSATPDVGAELAFALCEGRPVIALRRVQTPSAPFLEGVTREHPFVRQLSYDDLEECLAALDSVLGDLVWQSRWRGRHPVAELDTLLTLGHSNHRLVHFLELLRVHDVQGVADVRSWPASRHAPWFDREPLQQALQDSGVQYLFLGRELGGRPDGEDLYDEDGHVRYDALANSEEFAHGLQRLRHGIGMLRIAVMCAEENPEHCHRRLLVARVLFEEGMPVLHIRGDSRLESERGFTRLGSLFEEPLPWRSTASVSQRRQPRASSAA